MDNTNGNMGTSGEFHQHVSNMVNEWECQLWSFDIAMEAMAHLQIVRLRIYLLNIFEYVPSLQYTTATNYQKVSPASGLYTISYPAYHWVNSDI